MAQRLIAATLNDPRTGKARWAYVGTNVAAYARRAAQPGWVAQSSPIALRPWLLELLAVKPASLPPEVAELPELPGKRLSRVRLLEYWVTKLKDAGAPLLNPGCEEPGPGGRPRIYAPELADRVLKRIEAGESVRHITQDETMPSRATINEWRSENPEFAGQYARARDNFFEDMAEEMKDIADDGTNDWMERQIQGETIMVVDHEHIARSRARIDQRKWYLAKMAPRRFGERGTGDAMPESAKSVPPTLPPLPPDLRGSLLKHISLALRGQVSLEETP